MAEPPALPPGLSLQVWDARGGLVFQSQGRWLHPLFDLRQHLAGLQGPPPGPLTARDRIVGRGAAFLFLVQGICQVWTDLASQRARSLFEAQGAQLAAAQWVEKIDCLTEDLLAQVDDPVEALRLLEQRRALARRPGVPGP